MLSNYLLKLKAYYVSGILLCNGERERIIKTRHLICLLVSVWASQRNRINGIHTSIIKINIFTKRFYKWLTYNSGGSKSKIRGAGPQAAVSDRIWYSLESQVWQAGHSSRISMLQPWGRISSWPVKLLCLVLRSFKWLYEARPHCEAWFLFIKINWL